MASCVQCDVAIVGGGIGGMYAAYRILTGGVTVAAADTAAAGSGGGGDGSQQQQQQQQQQTRPPVVCTFEATNRIGGRCALLLNRR